MKLADLLGEAPKIFHSYLRERKNGCPSVGPLKLADGRVVHDSAGMSEEFGRAFSSVFLLTDPSSPEPFQTCDGGMEDIVITDRGLCTGCAEEP